MEKSHRFGAIIFDLDGTLLDSEAAAMRAGTLAFQDLGVTVDEAFMHGMIGKDYATGARIIKARFGDLDTDRLNTQWMAHSKRLRARDGVALKPGAVELLAHLMDSGLPMALATSSHHQSAHDKLRMSDLARYFPTVVTRDSVQNGKPAPDPYLLAAKLLGLAPADCLAFEDSDTGAAAAYAAGMQVVQIPDILPTQGRHAHHVADSLLTGARAMGLMHP